ncbi:Protein of uncharacterised function (DUF3592) [Bordetella ansorpii]|uniref:Protein of uncharacterized function (DUF3592) n=1 Tax=Bordetella ansorpii TaxID=288768 RepID=A0A157NST9_9BORD|nr:DUF3592 domain-containing protein [Bordetella ansorpii]SAI24392.1 Protein of uncharacterised function (DUF3592) [Bordetella ansorpii]
MAADPSTSRSTANFMRALLFTLVGLFLVASTGYLCYERAQFIRHSQVADGRVVKLNAGGSHPQIEFDTADNQRISYPQGGMIFGYEAGRQVKVRYLAENPQATAVLDTFGALWGMDAMMGAVGFIFLALGLSSVLRGGQTGRWWYWRT